MKLSSMTGFARIEGANEICSWIWEAKSVNSKGIGSRIKLPMGFELLEPTIRERIKNIFQRGYISIFLKINWHSPNAKYEINLETVAHLIKSIPKVEKIAPGLRPISMDGLFATNGVIESIETILSNQEQSSLNSELLSDLDSLLMRLQAARFQEGEELKSVLNSQVESIQNICHEVGELTLIQPERIRSNFEKQVFEIGGEIPALSEDRIAEEVLVLILKANIREELDRINIHTNAVGKLITDGGAIGRQLDFICQEFNREANTLCSKTNDPAITQLGLTLKTVIDQMREQVQNVE